MFVCNIIRFYFCWFKKKYYPQILLEECKCAVKNNKTVNTINEDLELSESDESDHESDE